MRVCTGVWYHVVCPRYTVGVQFTTESSKGSTCHPKVDQCTPYESRGVMHMGEHKHLYTTRARSSAERQSDRERLSTQHPQSTVDTWSWTTDRRHSDTATQARNTTTYLQPSKAKNTRTQRDCAFFSLLTFENSINLFRT